MNYKLFLLVGSVACITFSLGWRVAGVETLSEPRQKYSWEGLSSFLDSREFYQELRAIAYKSDIFPNSKNSSTINEELKRAPGQNKTEFPLILGISIISGTPYIYLQNSDMSLINASIGSMIGGGWKIIKLDMQSVTAYNEFDNRKYEFPISGQFSTEELEALKNGAIHSGE